jgi:hypothetical protein
MWFLPCSGPGQQLLAERVLDVRADRATQRPRAEVGVVPLLDQEVLGRLRELGLEALLLDPLGDLGDLVLDDLHQVVAGQRAEDDHVVEAVDELGAEEPLDLLHQDRLDVLVAPVAVRGLEAEPAAALDQVRADVDVMIRMVLRKSTWRPNESVRRPSSMIWSSMLNTSGWAFSTSSSRTTA